MTLKLIDHDGNAHDLNEVLEFVRAHKNAETQAAFAEKLAGPVKSQGQPDAKLVPAPIPSPEQQLERVLDVQRRRVLAALDGASSSDGGVTYSARLKFNLHPSLVPDLRVAGYKVSEGHVNNDVVSWEVKPKPKPVFASLAGGCATLSDKGYGVASTAGAGDDGLRKGGPAFITLGDGLIREGDPVVVTSTKPSDDWTLPYVPYVPYEPQLPSAARSRMDRDADERGTGGQQAGYLRLIRALIREAKPNTNGGCLAHYRYEFELPVLSSEHRVQVLKLLADQGYGTASRYRNGNPEQNYIIVLF